MKKQVVLPILATVLLALGIFAGVRYEAMHRIMGAAPPVEDALAPMVMVEDALWQLSDEQEGGFSRNPDGTVTEIIKNEIPYENGQANFGETGMPYWVMPDSVMIYTNGNYFLMKPLQE